MKVPFVDLHAQYTTIKAEIDEAIQQVLDESAFIRSRFVTEFEDAFAAELGVRHCIGVANGTDALFIALKMMGIGHGDQVITPAFSWISSSEAISLTGAEPVFVDIDGYHTLDADKLATAITPDTRAIMPVHLYGQMADMGAILEIAWRHGLKVLEDSAQAHFATYNDRYAGSLGDAGTFSFYPGKNLGAYGDGGAIVTDDHELAWKCRAFANHGQLKKHDHRMEGVNSRLDGLQAAVLQVKLPHIRNWTHQRKRVAALYDELLADVREIHRPRIRDANAHIFHLYSIHAERRDQLKHFLKERGIATAVHYPTALPLLPAYERLGHTPADFPRAYHHQLKQLSLPMFPEMREEQVQAVADTIHEFYGRRHGEQSRTGNRYDFHARGKREYDE